ncbi:hypothetical protein ACFE04_016507 [Oxalis oulophora]
MGSSLSLFTLLFFLLLISCPTSSLDSPCHSTCGSIQVKYPFGTGNGCGSSRFHPYITCSPDKDQEQLLLTTHTGSYPITSISYTTSTLTITPPYMSTCTSMQPSPTNLGLDWASPFQLGPSTFLLLSCKPPTSSLTVNSYPVCDASSSHLCASFHSCPSITSFGLPLFAPIDTCCVYAPANFNGKGELDLKGLKCDGYASVVSFADYPTEPARWVYGVELKYSGGAFDEYYMDNKCTSCETSGGVCGYSIPSESFVCLCNNGVNTTTDCYNLNNNDQILANINWDSASSRISK